ncbi:MAG TPA: hypothetical protein VMT11_21530 [Myxococcaceae bacterium]|nr:hypothetical protein [Myxococcaceae bacterium]
MERYQKDPEKQQFRDELARLLMVAWATQEWGLRPQLNAVGPDLERLTAKAKAFGESALAYADGFMAARDEHPRG